MKSEIKAIVFDIGGVLYDESMHNVYSALANKFKINYDEFKQIRDKYQKSAQIGELSTFQYPRLIAKDLGIKDIKKFINTWNILREKELQINKDVEKTVLKLKKNYVLGVLTNVTKINDKVRMKKKVYRFFDIKLISNKEGSRKPDIRFYDLLTRRLKCLPEEIIFIDDEEKQLVPAKELGMKVILFENNTHLIRDLKKLGVIV